LTKADPKDTSETDSDNEEGMDKNVAGSKILGSIALGTSQSNIQKDDETPDKSNQINKEVMVSNSIAQEIIRLYIPKEESDKSSQILAMLQVMKEIMASRLLEIKKIVNIMNEDHFNLQKQNKVGSLVPQGLMII